MENPDCKDSNIAVLESKVETFEQVFNRLDRAIEKITEVNNNVSRMHYWNGNFGLLSEHWEH